MKIRKFQRFVFYQPVYMIKAKVAFLEGRLFSSQSGLFENFLLWLCKQAI